ncbi:MAG: hypothetical protein ACOY0T_32720 [Myxococcota bacterium]
MSMLRANESAGFVQRALVACTMFIAGCGGGQAAQPASATPNESAAPADASATSEPEKPADAAASNSSTAASGSEAAGAANAPAKNEKLSLVALCEKGCDKMKANCSSSSVENCRMNCVQYEHPPAGCEEEARVALECANSAEDTTCVNIAPEICAHKFRRVVACANGKPIAAKDETTQTPTGWERYVAKSAGFASLMPKGVTESSEGGVPTYSAKQGDLTYSVRILPPPKERPTQKSMVQVAMGILGKCNQKLKLYGMVDRPEKIFIRFNSQCPDGTDWRGAFAITDKKLYMPFVTLPKGSKGEVDAFVYGFEVEK